MSNPVHLLAAGFGSGLAPRAPGTWGTLVGVALWLALAGLPLLAYLVITAGLFLVGVWICARAADDMGVHDHGSIVFDEMVGYLVTMAGLPMAWEWALAGFILFRVLDIIKPWPISVLDRRIKGGFGIMVDDLAAGLLAVACLHVAARVLG